MKRRKQIAGGLLALIISSLLWEAFGLGVATKPLR